MDGVEPYPLTFPTPMPPFLSKTYDMVEDASTDDIIEWGPQNNSFVVKDQSEFSRVLLPKYFKHGNFTSFVRQLNVYGFRKVDHDKWEFANEGFLRGQKHLLKHITRRKPSHTQTQSQPHSQTNTSTQSASFVELGNFGIDEEIERLKRDKDVLMQELIKLRQQQEDSNNQLQTMTKRVNGIEHHQKKIMSFLAKGMRRTDIFEHISGLNKKRKLTKQEEEEETTDVQLIKFQTAVESVDNGVNISKVTNESMLSDTEKHLSVNQIEETEKMSAIMDSLFDDSIYV